MPVEMKRDDLLRLGLIDPFELEEPAKDIAKRLKKDGLIENFNFKREIFTLARRGTGECIYLDLQTRRCTVYQQRPTICRKHPQVGPRPGFCAYTKK